MARPLFPVLLFFMSLAAKSCVRTSADRPAAASAPPVQVLDLRAVANQTQEDIATILGPQSSLSASDAANAICATCQKYAYQNDKILIEYTNDMADRITVRPPAGTSASRVPRLLGLPDKVPDVSDANRLQWTHYEGIREVNAFLNGDGTVGLVLVKVLTD